MSTTSFPAQSSSLTPSPYSSSPSPSPLYALYLLLRDGEIDPTETLITLIKNLDNFEELLLSVSLVSRFGAQPVGYIDKVSIPVYLYRKLGHNPEHLTSIYLIINSFSLTSLAFSDKPLTIREYFEDHLYQLPSPSLRTRTLKILLDRVEELSIDSETSEDILERYLIAAIRGFSNRCFSRLLSRVKSNIVILRLFLQAISTLNFEAFLLLILAGYPILPLYREILSREILAAKDNPLASRPLRSMISVMDPSVIYWTLEPKSELPFSLEYFSDSTSTGRLVVPAYWLTSNIDQNLEADLLRGHRSALKRLSIPLEKRFFPDPVTILELMRKTAILHGLPEDRLTKIDPNLQQRIFDYLGIPIILEKIKVQESMSEIIFLTSVYFVIYQDPAYSTNFFLALNKGYIFAARRSVDRHPSTMMMNAK